MGHQDLVVVPEALLHLQLAALLQEVQVLAVTLVQEVRVPLDLQAVIAVIVVVVGIESREMKLLKEKRGAQHLSQQKFTLVI